jgi:hypothetical protein
MATKRKNLKYLLLKNPKSESWKHLLVSVYYVCSNKSPGVKIGPAPPSLFLKGPTSFFKYMFLIINNVLCDKIHNSSTNIKRIISPFLDFFLLEKCYFYYNFFSFKGIYLKLQIHISLTLEAIFSDLSPFVNLEFSLKKYCNFFTF